MRRMIPLSPCKKSRAGTPVGSSGAPAPRSSRPVGITDEAAPEPKTRVGSSDDPAGRLTAAEGPSGASARWSRALEYASDKR